MFGEDQNQLFAVICNLKNLNNHTHFARQWIHPSAQQNLGEQPHVGEAAAITMELPPPLLDGSSDEEATPVDFSEFLGWLREGESEMAESESSDEPPPAWWLLQSAQFEHETCTGSDDARTGIGGGGGGGEVRPPDRAQLEEAASFVLGRMKQTQSGLQAWDHADFVRMANQSVLFQPSWKPLVVLQEAQAAAFTFGGQETSLINMWHGRRPGGVVKCVKDLGTLRQLRGSRLVPFRLGCNCLYDHPALTRMFRSNASDGGFPRLMHIHASMSGPVRIMTTDGVRPFCVAFAGAEFVVLDKTSIGNADYWMVQVELREFTLDSDQHEDSGPATPGLEGLPEMHARLGTHETLGVVAVTTEGMPTLQKGQAPTDIDRFKAWSMDPRYHAISHHVWGLDDLRIFLFMHRVLLTFAPLLIAFVRRCSIFMWFVAVAATVVLAVWKPTSESLMVFYFKSPLGAFVASCIQVFLIAYRGLIGGITIASLLLRGLLALITEVPHLLFPNKVAVGSNVIRRFVYRTLRFIMHAVADYYRRLLRGIVDHLPPVQGLGSTVRFIDGAIGFVINSVMMLVIGVASVLLWWYTPKPDPPFVARQAEYERLVHLTDSKSKSELLSLVRRLVFDARGDTDVAWDRLQRAIGEGARQCTGARRANTHACSAALAIAAVRLRRVASSKEKSAINRILVRSGLIRDSLVRTARVMLAAANPTKAVEEVAHELMHAAQAGLIWPDEHLIGLAVAKEDRNPTAENVAWHRAKWVAVAANMIVGRESSPSHQQAPWFVPLPDIQLDKDPDLDYRNCMIPPSERCVACYSNYARLVGESRTPGGANHMKTEGRLPPYRKGMSACKTASNRSTKPTARPHCEMPEEDCRVPAPMCCPYGGEFPFYHEAARQPKLEPDQARRLAARIASNNETYARLARRDKERGAANTSQAASNKSSSRARSTLTPKRHASQQQKQAPARQPKNESTSAAWRRGVAARRAREEELEQQQRVKEQEQERERQIEQARKEQRARQQAYRREEERLEEEKRRKEEERLEEQNRLKAETDQARERKAEQARAKAQEERRQRRVKARRERATDAEAVKRQRLQMLAADMRQLLLDDLNYDPDDTAMPQDASSRNNSSNDTNRSNGNICEGVATASANDSSSAAQKEAEKKEAEEEEDDLSLCIVCMTEKRNACLVHGKTSHQIVCLPCGERLKAAKMGCPVCKRPIQAVIENFTS